MINLNKYNFIIFDCDGVILDSNLIKFKGFYFAINEEDKIDYNKFEKFLIDNPHLSRFEKFEHFFKKIRNKNNFKLELNNALDNYSLFTLKNIKKAQFVLGFENFIKKLKKLNITLYVISATFENDLIEILKYKNILKEFKCVLGSPENKDINFKKVLKFTKSNNGLSFGDSKNDYLISKKYGLDFVFVNYFPDWKNFKKVKDLDYLIKDFNLKNFNFSQYT